MRDAFQLKLEKKENGNEQLKWYGNGNGKPVVFEKDPCSGFWRRFATVFLQLLPIESQL